MPGLFAGTPFERPVTCDRCGRGVAACDCPAAAPPPKSPKEFELRVRRERRRGKWCAVVAGLESDAATQKSLLKELRSALGAGGGVSDGELVLQGDCRDKVLQKLAALGYRAKPAGG
ncbi:translation initiation factor [Botrimarina mediterranea]|uniref:Translation initiation factor Sui1 n=1 Tax=Botrimarina mediterranea TaxID=2528022 RepID=A0A518K5U7_9BACT|nr:translation initiation factor [Botrimarina mediterranea]QDV73168.1 translation initiation factor Sui1 [Botrimarina mediterranea]QDV77741.1 translation initiation factor Sui1 [Planctomycetes bacterium K2D]